MTEPPLSFADLKGLLEWYEAMGVDTALGDDPVDRFAESAAQAEARGAQRTMPAAPQRNLQESGARFQQAPRAAGPSTPPPAAAGSMSGATLPGDDAVMAAREAARSAQSLEELESLLANFEGCNLRLTAKNLVFADGNPKARLMFVGEAPGRDEDIQGKPFVGRSGKLLDRMLKAIGLDRDSAYIANVIYWRPPGNRDPSDQEVAICRPFILRQIELVDPAVLVFLGNQPSKALVGRDAMVGIRKFRGRWRTFEVGGRQVPLMPTFHPAYLLRQPMEKRLAWRDFLEVKARLAAVTKPD
ncbi:uracil-DNA glycosylase, family 4 [Hartmannibacter diazotrophicus]|uniref:Type-4 uracil-DNA glycosylase n=1 Tax=Hartmannibacter diazotrophicus TaxID=1482074 RepID=A0A2C9D355_9HYPH|nr:uracil-DNA glycosylase [Hartmannibacter diazotrophicus]SON54696.1 uracil-DNA glycosylase, family 4 [Hartmannibacter diazotrophicus]